MYKVIICCGWITHDLVTDLTEGEVIQICQENNWEYYDENCFCWHMDYVDE